MKWFAPCDAEISSISHAHSCGGNAKLKSNHTLTNTKRWKFGKNPSLMSSFEIAPKAILPWSNNVKRGLRLSHECNYWTSRIKSVNVSWNTNWAEAIVMTSFWPENSAVVDWSVLRRRLAMTKTNLKCLRWKTVFFVHYTIRDTKGILNYPLDSTSKCSLKIWITHWTSVSLGFIGRDTRIGAE